MIFALIEEDETQMPLKMQLPRKQKKNRVLGRRMEATRDLQNTAIAVELQQSRNRGATVADGSYWGPANTANAGNRARSPSARLVSEGGAATELQRSCNSCRHEDDCICI